MKKYIKYIIIILIILALVISIILVYLINNTKLGMNNEVTNIQNQIITYEKEHYEGYEFQPLIIDSATLASMYLNDFKTDMMYNIEDAYNKLESEYRQKKFPTLNSFQNYIEDNKEQIQSIAIDRYSIETEENANSNYSYIITDKNNKYYIFNVSAVMQYTVILDTYTIDLPQFIEQYNNATDAEKVLMNIQKVFAAINDGDYNYVYNKLDNTFKQNNFPTLENFEKYIKENLYKNNSISYTNYQTNANLHIYEINIKNADVEKSSVITKNFIMQLLDGTDFVMSFNV